MTSLALGVIQDISSVPLRRCPGSVGPAGAGFDFTCMPVMQTAKVGVRVPCARRTPDGGGDKAGKGAGKEAQRS